MIPALLIWLFNAYLAPRINKKNRIQRNGSIGVFILLSCYSSALSAQQGNFIIKRNGNVIGHLSVSLKEEGDQTFLKITSKVDTRFLFRLQVETEDIAHFKNGRLIRSGVNRIVNGDEKEPKETQWIHNVYEVRAGHKTRRIAQPIYDNMMLLYVREPVNLSQIYSDNFQCFLPVRKKGENQYAILLPDGNRNEYYFEKGVCKRIILYQGLYTLSMERAS